jgi:hypothetical protein
MITLTTADLQISMGGTRMVWDPQGSLSVGKSIVLKSIRLTGSSASLYGLEYIGRDDNALWSNRFTFDCGADYVQCINDDPIAHTYDGSSPIEFNLYDKHFDPVATAVRYTNIEIELAVIDV